MSLGLLLPLAPAWAGEPAPATIESLIDIDVEVDQGVTDPRGDESPNPREDDLVCDNVVCGDEGKTCASCGKPAE